MIHWLSSGWQGSRAVNGSAAPGCKTQLGELLAGVCGHPGPQGNIKNGRAFFKNTCIWVDASFGSHCTNSFLLSGYRSGLSPVPELICKHGIRFVELYRKVLSKSHTLCLEGSPWD